MSDDLTLWDIESGIYECMERLEDAREHGDSESIEEATTAIAAYVAAEITKVDGIGRYIRFCKAQAQKVRDHIASETERLCGMAEKWDRRSDSVANAAIGVLRATGKRRVESAIMVIRRQKNPDSVEITDAVLIPSKFVRVTVQMSEDRYWRLIEGDLGQIREEASVIKREIMKSEIKPVLMRGETVPGASLITDSEHLRIE